VVILGDNIIEKDIRGAVRDFERQERGAKIFIKEVADPERFGVPELDGDRVVRIVEKPAEPPSRYRRRPRGADSRETSRAAQPLRGYRHIHVRCPGVRYSQREMTYQIIDGWWTDAGTFDSLLRASNLVAARDAPATST